MLLVFDSTLSLDIARLLHSTQRRQALARASYTQMYGLHGVLGEHARETSECVLPLEASNLNYSAATGVYSSISRNHSTSDVNVA